MSIYPPGALIAGRYEVASRPLMGGMGIVYVCLDHEENHPVALKTFKPEYLPDRAARDRFLREGTAWVDLGRHPHIVRAYGVERIGDGREVYLVLELVAKQEGRADASLRSWLVPGRPLPLEQALLFGLQIVRGMAHATATIPGLVHRDLKPENVLVGADRLSNAKINRLRVTDFGLAAVLQEAGQQINGTLVSKLPAPSPVEGSAVSGPLRRTQLTRGIVGTPLYMAPEQWKGERVTVQTDVYALGCILYEMLAGQRAVVGSSLEALRRAHCQGEVRPLPQDLSATVGEVLARCLALEPWERYESWEAAEAALVAAYEQVVGQPAPAAEPAAALGRKERVAAGWSYNAMGNSYLDIGKAEVAAGYFERAQEVGEAEGERELEGAALGNLGIAYAALGEARRAIGYYEQHLEIAREIGDRRGEGNVLGNLGIAYKNLGEVRRAIGYYEQALTIAREIGDRRREGNALGNLGLAYADLGEVRRAIGYYEQELAVAREIGDRWGEGNTLGNLGIAYKNLGEARRAIGYYEQHLEIAREIGDRRGEGNALGNLGNAYLQLGEARQAIGYYEQALEIAREIGDRRNEGNWLGNLGIAYKNLGEARRAVGYFGQCLSIHREIGDAMGVAAGSFNMANLLAEQGRLSEALPYAEQAAQVVEQIGHAEKARQAYQFVAQIRAALR